MYKQVMKRTGILLSALGILISSVAYGAWDPWNPIPAPPPYVVYCYVYCIDYCGATGMCVLQDGSIWGPFSGYASECCI